VVCGQENKFFFKWSNLNNVVLNYVENEKVFVINTDIAILHAAGDRFL